VLAVAAVGPAPGEVLAAMEAALVGAFGLPAGRVAAIDEPARAFSPPRGQWSSVAFLETLLARVPPEAARLLGVTERDLFVPVLSFVYGQAQLGGPVAVVSLARLRPEFHGLAASPAVLARRAATEAVHEVGHTFGLVHCPDRRCPMSLSIDLPDLDGKTAVPCPACRAMIEGSREMGLARRRVEGEHP
jgi:archaemetzincin